MNLSKRYLWLAASLLVLYLVPAHWLELQRDAVFGGEVWRLFTAHWSHVGLVHLVLNTMGVLVIAVLFPADTVAGKDGWAVWLLSIAGLALGVSATLLVTLPELAWYRGFSGCLYGLLMYEAMRHLPTQRWTALAVLILVVGKLVLDALGLSGDGSVALIGAAVIDTAHVAGATIGAGLGAVHLWRRSAAQATAQTE